MKQHSFCSSNNEFMEKRHFLSQTINDDEIEILKNDVGNYPNNITFWNYWDFLLIPTFVYHLSYPRTERFRIGYFIVKLGALVSTFSLIYLLTEHYIHPIMDKMPYETAYESLIQLAMPFGCCYILVFFLIFECVTNLFAEITLYFPN
jgi:sterol O-acyltransferase